MHCARNFGSKDWANKATKALIQTSANIMILSYYSNMLVLAKSGLTSRITGAEAQRLLSVLLS